MTETSQWLHRAAALQRFIGYDIPLDSLTLTATHNSFSSDRDISTHANFEVLTAQVYSITDQLNCLGVRGLELDLHYIGELAVEGDEESAIRLCHASADVAEQVSTICTSFGWDVCEEADIYDYGEDTGCRPGAPTAREGFEEVATWLEENESEVVFIKLDSSLNDEVDTVSTIVADIFGEDAIFSPADWEEFSGSEGWPSPAELVALGTRVIIAGSEPSELVFSTADDAVEVLISAEDFDANTCGDNEGFPEPSWHRVQGDMVQYRLDRGNSTIFELIPDSEDALTESMTPNVMNCGLTPTFDRFDSSLMESTIWSWATDRPETGFTSPRAAVVSTSDSGRWTDVDSDADGGARHSYACRNSDADLRYDWVVVPVDSSSFSSTVGVDGSGTSGGSSSTTTNYALRQRRLRNRGRRLYSTTSGDGYDEDGDDYDDGLAEYSDYTGTFEEAQEACESVGYVFGAPRTAYENAWLRIQMQGAGVETAWVDHTSQGDELGSSLCWSLEGGTEYCVDVSDDTCSATPEPVTEFADGQLPYFEVGDWEDLDYVRPDYAVSSTVESLHGWTRVAGDNDFDISDRGYVVGIILAAVPVFVFGFMVACCCLPVGHIAAGSKQHHVDGNGFFGCFCPARCKRGDLMGSGILAVVLVFTVLTIVGGAATIYGVRTVDGEVVSMVDNLQYMGQDMVSAQSGIETIYGLLVNVEESFESISSCSLVSSIEGVEGGIASAKEVLEELIDDDLLGSVGRGILDVEAAFSDTADTRRGVVYCAGALVLVLSAIYVSVGYYALRKDGGRGKSGGARMRGPVLIGCLTLPLTLMVILLCWFLFGVSTSVALVTSDFCVAPSEHTVEVFSSPTDQEVVDFYTSCEGANDFSDQLATAYLQGAAAQGLLDAIDDDEFSSQCPDQVTNMEALDSDITEILAQISALGFLVQCSRVNPYFVEGVEVSLCNDAPESIWFVIGGFGAMSVGLFIVAVSFRLLLQQKEEGLYRVIFEDELDSRLSSATPSYDGRSEDSFYRGHGGKSKKMAAVGGVGVAGGRPMTGKISSHDDGSKRSSSVVMSDSSWASSAQSTQPSSTSPTPRATEGGGGGRVRQQRGVATVSVKSVGLAEDLRQQKQQQVAPAVSVNGGSNRSTPAKLPRAREPPPPFGDGGSNRGPSRSPPPYGVGDDYGGVSGARGRSRSRSRSRSHSRVPSPAAAGKTETYSGDAEQRRQQRRRQEGTNVKRTRAKPVELGRPLQRPLPFESTGSEKDRHRGDDHGHGSRSRSRSPLRTAAMDEEAFTGNREGRGRGGGRGVSRADRTGNSNHRGASRGGRDRRSNNDSSADRGGHGHWHPNDVFESQSGRTRSTRLFRALAGLDDPEDEAPSVIVSRHAGQRPTRNHGGGGATAGDGVDGASEVGTRLTVTFGRASSVVGSSSRRRSRGSRGGGDRSGADTESDHEDDEDQGHVVWGGSGRRGRGGSKKSSEGRGWSGRSSVEGGSSAVNGLSGTAKRVSGRFLSNSGPISTSVDVVAPPPSGGTWAAFSRDCARPTEGGSGNLGRSREQSNQRRRQSSRGGTSPDESELESKVRRFVARGSGGHRGAAGGASANSSHDSAPTEAGLTDRRTQRLDQRAGRDGREAMGGRDRARERDGDRDWDHRGGITNQGAGKHVQESKHNSDHYGKESNPSQPQGSRGAAGAVMASDRAWNKAATRAAEDSEGGSGRRTRAGTTTSTVPKSTGLKDLSTLSRPSRAETNSGVASRTTGGVGRRAGASVAEADRAGISASSRSSRARRSGNASPDEDDRLSSREEAKRETRAPAARGGGGRSGGDGRRR